jgi:zinc protease
MITQPTFPADELVKVKESMLGRVRQRLDDAGALASAHVQNLLWGNDHVRGWVDSEASIASIKREDLVAWHKTWFVPQNAMLVVTGDVDTAKLGTPTAIVVFSRRPPNAQIGTVSTSLCLLTRSCAVCCRCT